jgi:hypothetical protein
VNDASPASSTTGNITNAAANFSGRIKAAAWTAGLTAFFVLASLSDSPTWPEAFVAACVLAMVGFVCYLILYYR